MNSRFLGKFPLIISLLLFLVPFTWFPYGSFDWGGDSSRLYYLDPYSYLVNHTLYGVSPSETGGQIISFYTLPYILLIYVLRTFLQSTTVVALFHGIKLSFAFLFTYLIIRELLSNTYEKAKQKYIELSAITGGFLYIFSPLIFEGWDKPIFTHDQIFLNPLMLYLFLRFIIDNKFIFLAFALLVSLLFAHNFSFGAAPAIFSFYPLTFAFVIFYQLYIRRKKIYWHKILYAFFLFLILHSFHLVPIFMSILEPSSDIYTNLFTATGKIDRGLSYFVEISKNVKLSRSLFVQPQLVNSPIEYLYLSLLPITVVVALIIKKNKFLLTTILFFLISLFFAAANITTLGIEIYKFLFYAIPGFSMFRNFFGQWSNVFLFFYILIFCTSLFVILENLKTKLKFILPIIIIGMSIITAWSFINGNVINKEIWQSNGIKIVGKPTREFLESIEFVRKLPEDLKVLTLPISDPGYQIIAGEKGSYQGPSTIAYLAGKRDFPGEESFGIYNDLVKQAFAEADIKLLKLILAKLNIGYIYFNSDESVYSPKFFPSFPYQSVRSTYPKSQQAYQSFIEKLNVEKIAQFGKYYHVYKLQDNQTLPHIYSGNGIIQTNNFLKTFPILGVSVTNQIFIPEVSYSNISLTNIYKAEEINPYILLRNNYHLHIHEPYVSLKPDNLLYPLILIKEKQELSEYDDSLANMVDHKLLILSKRFKEMELWGNEMKLNSSPGVSKYMTWETNLERYKKGYQELVSKLEEFNSSEGEINAEKVKINEQLSRHQVGFISIVKSFNLKKEDKGLLLNKLNQNYIDIEKEVSLPIFDEKKVNYLINVPIRSNTYNLYLENLDKSSSLAESIQSVQVGDLQLPSEDSIITPNFIKYNNVNLANKFDNKISIDFLDNNLVNNFNDINVSSEDLKRKSYGYSLNKIKRQTQYLISFEYRTDVDGYFSYALLDKKKDESTLNEIFKKNLHSVEWKREQTIITTDPNFVDGVLEFLSNGSGDGRLWVRNASIRTIISPVLLIEKREAGNLGNPQIYFKKINPTRYEINIKDINRPFILTFSDAFSKDWKLFESQKRSDNEKIILGYKDLNVFEFAHTNKFFETNFLETWSKKPIADNKHFTANGFSNAWYIDPQDINNNRNISFVLENTSQRYFYIGLLVSLVCLFGIILGFLFYFGRKIFVPFIHKYKDYFFFLNLKRELSSSKTVLDIGCGEDSPLGRIKKTFYSEGFDVFSPSIDKSKTKNIHDKYKKGDILNISKYYKPNSFDAVIALDVIEHLTKSQGKKLLKQMDLIARKKVIILTPNGFVKQGMLKNNKYQIHKSGWDKEEFEIEGFKVIGLRGYKKLRGEYASIKYKPWFFWGFISLISEPLLTFFPKFSYHLLAIKNKK